MSIIKRKKRNTPFVQIDKRALQDKNLSWKAKGILAYILSLPDNWQIYLNELKEHSTDGRDSTASGFKELVKAGYITKTQVREGGKFKGYDYTVTDEPCTDSPKTEKPKTVKPITENPPLIIIEDNNKDFKNKESNNKEDSVYKKDTHEFPSNKGKKTYNPKDKRTNKKIPFNVVSAKKTLDALFPSIEDLESRYNEIFRNYKADREIFEHCLTTFVEVGISNYYTGIRDIVLLEKNLLEWIKKEVLFRKRDQKKQTFNNDADTNEDGTPAYMMGLK